MEKVLINIKNEGLYDIFRKDTVTVNELLNAIKDLKCELDSLIEQNESDYEPDPYDIKMDYMLDNNLI